MLVYVIAVYVVLQSGGSIAVPPWLTFWSTDTVMSEAASMPCGSDMPRRENMAGSNNPQLRKLAAYESVCKAAFADDQMVFSAMPTTTAEARQLGNQMATSLKELDAYTVHPLVVLEPVSPDGAAVSLAQGAAGDYDAALGEYFRTIKNRGITDAMMGTWVWYPEANTPVWTETDPDDFVAAITRTVRLQKQLFAGSKASVLLGSQSYPSNDTAWMKGAFKSLAPYTRDIPVGLIDSFGYQGFPWMPPANQRGYPLTAPATFLRTDYAAAAAAQLGVRSIWFNTGTFARAHAGSQATLVTVTAAERKQILQGALVQAGKLQREGFEVAVTLFAEDKSATAEGVDWSYGTPGGVDNQVLVSFIKQAATKGVSVSIYDDDHQGNGMLSGYRLQQR